MVTRLLHKGADSDFQNPLDGATSCFAAAVANSANFVEVETGQIRQHAAVIRRLAASGADVNIAKTTPQGLVTPLMAACHILQFDRVRALVECGANVHATDGHNANAADYATMGLSQAELPVFGSGSLAPRNPSGKASCGKIVKYLTEKGAPPKDADGMSNDHVQHLIRRIKASAKSHVSTTELDGDHLSEEDVLRIVGAMDMSDFNLG